MPILILRWPSFETAQFVLTANVLISYPYGKLWFMPRDEYVRTYPYKKPPFDCWVTKANRPIVHAYPTGKVAATLFKLYKHFFLGKVHKNRLKEVYQFVPREEYKPDTKRYEYLWWNKHNGRKPQWIDL